MHSYKKLIFFFLGICFFLFGFYLRWKTLDFVYFNEWIARDIDRAFNLIEGINIPLAGPELNNGGRLPGPFLYFLLAIPLLFKKSIESIFYFNFAINTFALVFLFFMIKKNFGIFVAILNLIFISVYLPNIFVFSFPANPSFIFPLIALYLWFLLELVCKGEHKYLPIIVLLVSLGIQLHMSMATLYFPPIILLLIFKSRPQTKYLVLSLFVILICFFPYWLYKFKTFIPITEIKNNGSFYFLSSNILIRFLEIIFLKSTILRLTYNNGFESRLLFTNEIVVAYFCLFCFGLIYWIFKFYKKGFQFYKKEFVVFISFYIPAILYEVIGVGMFHLWYTNIFVYSIFLLTSLAIYGVYKDLSRYKVSYIIFLIQLFLILTLANDAYRQVLIYKNMIASRDLKTNYKNTNKLIAVISDALDVNQNEFQKNIFLDYNNFSFFSKRQIIQNFKIANKTKVIKNNLRCFYIYDKSYMSDGYKRADSGSKKNKSEIKRLNSFLNDPTIDIEPLTINGIGFVTNEFVEVFNFYEYKPINFNQPCYNNFENPFIVKRDFIDLLKDAKLLSHSKSAFPLKVLKRDNNFDLKSQIVSLDEIYIFIDENIQAPIKVHVQLDKNLKDPFLKVSLKSYSFNGKSILLNSFQLIFVDMSDTHLIKKLEHKFEVINKKMFIGNNRGNNNYGWKLDWYKKFDLPSSFNLKKNKYKIFLTYDLALDGIKDFKQRYSNKVGIEYQGFNGNQVNEKTVNNWRKLKIFDFIM